MCCSVLQCATVRCRVLQCAKDVSLLISAKYHDALGNTHTDTNTHTHTHTHIHIYAHTHTHERKRMHMCSMHTLLI